MISMVPIPPDHVGQTEHVWRPFVERVAKRNRDHVGQYLDQIRAATMYVILGWDDQANVAVVALGVRYVMRGDERVAELIWMTGHGRDEWQHLIADVEKYLKENQNCVGMRAIIRRGWKPFLRSRGYRETHVMMEKEL